jgi:hypothetical protein
MSRGAGRIQRAIAAAWCAEPHLVWSVSELCRVAYPVSASTGSRSYERSMSLSGAWTITCGNQGCGTRPASLRQKRSGLSLQCGLGNCPERERPQRL